MGPVLLVVHVLAAVLFVGPAAVSASLFPAAVPLGVGEARRPRDERRSADAARLLHRVSRVYGLLAVSVPVAGIVLGLLWGKFDEAWLVVALGLTVAAGVLLAVRIVPGQAAMLRRPPGRREVASAAALVGVFNLLWVVVLVLMVLQPGAPER
ncbi:hypothetical protein [Amnibacterium setariae]|uniref:DUF2269 family protein n=1 Tax=Amnibacterium setariae TaxID=2306585 RepID=A0A3A1TXG6_9MICO|nr:hypothetical protein [Amnibacterium setariae]RIX26399.1 hypothetical protein D1781_15735 [Amnibacterium setariae]